MEHAAGMQRQKQRGSNEVHSGNHDWCLLFVRVLDAAVSVHVLGVAQSKVD
jgi:hypothetical protein